MGSTNDSSNHKTFDYTDEYVPFPPPSFLRASVESKGCLNKSEEGVVNYHQRCSSESFLIEEQPSWLDDLLNDTENVPHRGHHRRSASDSYAYLEEAAETFFGRSSRSQNLTYFKNVDGTTFDLKMTSGEQGMLEREIGRLQNLYHMQKQQQMQMQMQMQNQQQPHNQHPKHRRNKSKDLDHQINASPVKNKDATSTKGSSVNGSFRV